MGNRLVTQMRDQTCLQGINGFDHVALRDRRQRLMLPPREQFASECPFNLMGSPEALDVIEVALGDLTPNVSLLDD